MERVLHVLVGMSLLAGLIGVVGCATKYAIYTIAVTVVPSQGGNVSLAPEQDTYDSGTRVTVTAQPSLGWRFDHWEGDAGDTSIVVTITMDGDKTVIAHFTRVYTLTANVSPTDGGEVVPSSGTYDSGTQVSLTAQPATGWNFDHWEGDAAGTSSSVTITMDTNKRVTACFWRIIFEDDFIDNRNNWPTCRKGEPRYMGVEEYIENGAYHLVTHYPIEYTASFKWLGLAPCCPNFAYEASVTKIEGGGSQEYGIIFLRRDDMGGPRGTLQYVITGQGRYALKQLDATSKGYEYVVPLTESGFIERGNALNTLKVVCRSSVIELHVNGHLLKAVTGQFRSDIGCNGIGLVAGADIHIALESIKMWSLE